MSLKDIILAAKDTRLVQMHVPEWDCIVYLPAGVSVADVLGRPKIEGESQEAGYARYAAFVIRDETGARVFTDAEAAGLTAKNFAVIERILEKYASLNGTGDDTDTKASSATA